MDEPRGALRLQICRMPSFTGRASPVWWFCPGRRPLWMMRALSTSPHRGKPMIFISIFLILSNYLLFSWFTNAKYIYFGVIFIDGVSSGKSSIIYWNWFTFQIDVFLGLCLTTVPMESLLTKLDWPTRLKLEYYRISMNVPFPFLGRFPSLGSTVNSQIKMNIFWQYHHKHITELCWKHL